jgi:hypothetical protein
MTPKPLSGRFVLPQESKVQLSPTQLASMAHLAEVRILKFGTPQVITHVAHDRRMAPVMAMLRTNNNNNNNTNNTGMACGASDAALTNDDDDDDDDDDNTGIPATRGEDAAHQEGPRADRDREAAARRGGVATDMHQYAPLRDARVPTNECSGGHVDLPMSGHSKRVSGLWHIFVRRQHIPAQRVFSQV